MDDIARVKLAWARPKYAAMLPARATPGAAGFDLSAFGEHELRPFEVALVDTGWKIEVDAGFEAQVRPRSGLALKHGITIVNSPGTIDSDYRGEIKVILMLLRPGKPFVIRHGDRIAQLVIAPVYMGNIEISDTLTESIRGEGGFGSTGV